LVKTQNSTEKLEVPMLNAGSFGISMYCDVPLNATELFNVVDRVALTSTT